MARHICSGRFNIFSAYRPDKSVQIYISPNFEKLEQELRIRTTTGIN